jgi:hypothetical protein
MKKTSDSSSSGETGTPRWVKVFGIIALIVVVAFIILMFIRGPGGHGPGRHMPPVVPERGVPQPR